MKIWRPISRLRIFARDAAIYVEPNDETKFAEAIAQLMDQPELQKKMGAYGRRRVEDELQWAKVGNNLLTAYETLLAEMNYSCESHRGNKSTESRSRLARPLPDKSHLGS